MKKTKHPKDMTTDEAIEHLFTPKGVEMIKRHIEKLSDKKEKPKK